MFETAKNCLYPESFSTEEAAMLRCLPDEVHLPIVQTVL